MLKIRKSDHAREIIKVMKVSDEELEEVIRYGEESGEKLYQPEKNFFLAKKKINERTIYVEYSLGKDGAYEVHTAYAHKAIIRGYTK